MFQPFDECQLEDHLNWYFATNVIEQIDKEHIPKVNMENIVDVDYHKNNFDYWLEFDCNRLKINFLIYLFVLRKTNLRNNEDDLKELFHFHTNKLDMTIGIFVV